MTSMSVDIAMTLDVMYNIVRLFCERNALERTQLLQLSKQKGGNITDLRGQNKLEGKPLRVLLRTLFVTQIFPGLGISREYSST